MPEGSGKIDPETNARVQEILEVVMSFARLDFSKKTTVMGNNDLVDAIGAGVNMLGEELETSLGSLKEKEKLLKEIHHRVKNNLQIVSSLLSLQSENVHDKKFLGLIAESQNRINSMAIVHEMLYSSRDLSKISMKEYIERLGFSVYHSFFKPGLNVKLNYDVAYDLFFDIDHIVPLGLVLNEILSNSFKYAFPNNKGQINICLHRQGNTCNLIARDDGIGFKPGFIAEKDGHLGIQLIHMLSDQLDGKIEIKQENGVAYHITFPC
jgi:two-component sensor histidine kinase